MLFLKFIELLKRSDKKVKVSNPDNAMQGLTFLFQLVIINTKFDRITLEQECKNTIVFISLNIKAPLIVGQQYVNVTIVSTSP